MNLVSIVPPSETRRRWGVCLLALVIPGLGACPKSGEGTQSTTSAADSTPQRLNRISNATLEPLDLAFDDAGNGVALWQFRSGTGSKVLWSYLDATSGTWSPDEVLQVESADGARLACDGSSFLLAWQGGDGDSSRIRTRVFDGVAWGEEATHSYGDEECRSPQLSFNGSEYLLAWTEIHQDAESVVGQRFDGSSWGEIELLEQEAGCSCKLQLAAGGTGFAVVWLQSAGIDYEVHGNVYDGETWRGSSKLGDAAGLSDTPRVVGNSDGFAVAWVPFDEVRDLRGAVYRQATASWTAVTTLNTGGGGVSRFDLGADASGFRWVWAQKQTPQDQSLFARSYLTGVGWQAESLVHSCGGLADFPVLASDGDGTMAAWHQCTAAGADNWVYVASFEGGAWSPPGILSDWQTFTNSLHLASDGAGYALSWTGCDDGPWGICASVHDGASWGSPRRLDASAVGVFTGPSASRLVPSAGGYVALWAQDDDEGCPKLRARRFTSYWEPERELSQLPARGGCSRPGLAANDKGSVLATWVQFHELQGQPWGSLRVAGHWSAPFSLLDALTPHVDEGPCVVSNGKSFLIAYTSYGRVATRGCAGGGVLADPVEHGEDTREPVLASNGFGYAVAWQSADAVHARLFVGDEWGEEMTWDSQAQVLEPGHGIASNGSGYAIAWKQQEPAGPDRIYASVHDGLMWSVPAAVDSGVGDPHELRLASNGEGYAVCWRRYMSDSQLVFVAVHDGVQWGSEVSVSAVGLDAHGPWIASDGDGYAVGWRARDSGRDEESVRLSRFSRGAWSEPEVLHAGPEAIDHVRVTQGCAGYAVLWCAGEGEEQRLLFSREALGDWSAGELLDGEPGAVSEVWAAACAGGFLAGWCRFDGRGDPVATDIWVSGIE